jgi:small-conductance mechanosensitive channel
MDGLAKAPQLLAYQLQLSLTSIFRALGGLGPKDWIVFIAWASGLLLALAALRYGLERLDSALRQDTATPVIAGIVKLLSGLLRMNLLSIGLVLIVVALARVLIVAPPNEEILLTLVACAVGTKVAVNLAWLLLARPDLPAAQRQPRLYRLLAISFWSGGLLIALTTVAHLSLLSRTSLDLLDRLFMFYLLLTFIPVLWAHRVLVQRMTSYYGQRPWVRLVLLTSLIVPVALLGIGLAGSLGYLSLAWIGVHYLLIFATVLVGWMLSQQLLNDLTAWLKHRALERSRREWSSMRRVADALRRVLSLWLFLAAIFLLIEFYSLEGTLADAWKVLMTAIVIVMALYEMLLLLADRAAEKSEGAFIVNLVDQARKPLGVILPIAAAQITLRRLSLPDNIIALGGHALTLVQIGAIIWLFLRLTSLLDQVAEHRYRPADVKEDLVARRARTQLRVLRQSLHVTLTFVGLGAMLMTFPGIRQLGAGLLASAGAAGLVIGIAARPLFENLIAGIQIALTQPIRLDDVVIVEGEWGTIEEINATYVVVQIWDDRRLVLPLKYFNEHPFQHWSRKGTDLLGSVFLNVDYSFPVEEGRKFLKRILDETDLWDGRAWVLQVTDSKEYGMELRALATAKDAPTAWDLRCYVREKLIAFIQEHYPASLPQRRTRYVSDEQQREEEKPAAPSFVIQSGLRD